MSCLGSLVKLTCEDVGENSVVAAALHVLEILYSLVVVASEDVNYTDVGLGGVCASLLEVLGGGLVVTLAECDHTKSVGEVGVFLLNISESLLCLLDIVGVEVGYSKVEPGLLAVVLADCLVVKLNLADV